MGDLIDFEFSVKCNTEMVMVFESWVGETKVSLHLHFYNFFGTFFSLHLLLLYVYLYVYVLDQIV